MLNLLLMLAPAAGGALALHLWNTRAPAIKHTGLVVGQVTIKRRGTARMAVRRGVRGMNLARVIELSKAARAAGTPGPMSTDEALTVAVVLNRHDWLQEEGFTIAQALDRIDADTIPHLRAAERALQAEFGPAPLSVSLDAQLAALRDSCVQRHEQLLAQAKCVGIKAAEARVVRERWLDQCLTSDLVGLKNGSALMRNISRNTEVGGSLLNGLQVKMASEYLNFAVAVTLLRFGYDLEQGVFHA